VSARSALGALAIAVAILALAPDPRALRESHAAPRETWIDAGLRVPFTATLVRSVAPSLRPGERVLGLRVAGDTGLVAPRDRAALLRAIRAGASVALDVHGPSGARRVAAEVAPLRAVHALATQWPLWLASTALLLFALACVLGGRHPVATPLFAVALCLGTAIGSAVGVVLPADAGLFGCPELRARLGVLGWCLLPAALLHLAARFPVVVPSFRRRAIAIAPYALWAFPALLAQLRFREAASVDAVERLALAASFLAGGILVAACARPVRRLAPAERDRARAVLGAFVAAGIGPLVVFVRGEHPVPIASAAMALASLALPLALGFAVARHGLLDPPGWLRRATLSIATALVALVCAAAVGSAIGEALGAAQASDAVQGAALALGTALVYQAFRSAATQLVAPRLSGAATAQRLLTRASRELAGVASPRAVLERFTVLLRDELRPAAIEVHGPEDPTRPDTLGARARSLWEATPAAGRRLVCAPRHEDPEPTRPELVLAVDARSGPATLLALSARSDGLPYTTDERRALADSARLAALAIEAAAASERLEVRVAARTAELSRALDDRSAVLDAAARIQIAPHAGAVRDAVTSFLKRCTGRAPVRADESAADAGSVALVLDTEPSRSERWSVHDLAPERVADLQPQIDAVAAFAHVALERIHLVAQLKLEVTRQARELAAIASGERCAAFVREVAHELRKPAEEIRELARSLAPRAEPAALERVERIEAITHELSRRLDCLLARGAPRLDLRRIDLVRLADEAVARLARLRRDRRFETSHALARLPLVGDPVRIASLLENLLDNAIQATAPGGRIALRSFAAADGGVAVEVEDDGHGIAPELGEEIFEPGVGRFRRGFGLGLALCREVATAHGGSIAIESAPGRTLFRVELPRFGGVA
jgi:signal transduction histidine kinase